MISNTLQQPCCVAEAREEDTAYSSLIRPFVFSLAPAAMTRNPPPFSIAGDAMLS